MLKLNWKPKTNLEKAGTQIVQLLNNRNHQAFFVGGAVRDRLLKRVSDNLDIATDALPDEVEEVLVQAGIHYKQIGKAYGTILAVVNKEPVEITTFRREGRYSDQRHPDKVEFIREYLDDAQRRDLTINALYFNPLTGELFDPVNGASDLKKKIIRFVGDPKHRIDEDSLRMLRAVRLAATLGFKIEKNSFAAIKTRAKYIQDISGERVKQELDKLLLSPDPSAGIKLLDSSGLLKFILGELVAAKNVFHKSKNYHLEGSVFEHTLKVLENVPRDLELQYAALFHDLGKVTTGAPGYRHGEWVMTFNGHQQVSSKIFNDFANKYKFSKDSREMISWLVLRHDDRLDFMDRRPENQIKYALHPDFLKLVAIWKADSAGNLRRVNGKIKGGESKAAIYGKQLGQKILAKQGLMDKFAGGGYIMKETKIPAGIRIGQISEKMKIAIVEGSIKDDTTAKSFLKKYKTH